MKPTDYKKKLIEEINSVNDDDTLQKLYSTVHSIINDTKKETNPTFEEWNKQFEDNIDLNEYIPEYGMTLKEFRTGIYKSEISGNETSISVFQKKLQNIYEK